MSFATLLPGGPGVTLSIENGNDEFTVAGVLLNAGDAIIAQDKIIADNREAYIVSINEDGDGGIILGPWGGATLTDSEDWTISRSSPVRLDALQAAIVTREANNNIRQFGEKRPAYSIIDIANTPPGSPLDGEAYIVSTLPTGAWVGQTNKIATYSSASDAWTFTTPRSNETANVRLQKKSFFFDIDTPAWVAVGDVGPGYATTSSSSNALANSGTVSWEVDPGLAYDSGVRFRASDHANPTTKYMELVCTSYDGTTLVGIADYKKGSGTVSNWDINVAGDVGADGIIGPTGATGATGPAGPGLSGTSATPNDIELAVEKTFTTQSGKGWTLGQRLRPVSNANSAKWMSGKTTFYSGNTLKILPDRVGTAAVGVDDWNINVDGEPGFQGNPGDIGPIGPVPATNFTFDPSSNADADPGNGKVRFNNATFALITQLFIDTLDINSLDISAWLDSLDDSTSPTKGELVLIKLSDGSTVAKFQVTAVTSASGYRKISVAPVSGSIPVSSTPIAAAFYPKGDAGASGSGTGDMLAAQNLADLSNKQVGFDNLSLLGIDIASASTIDLDSVSGSIIDITGSNPILSIILTAGRRRWVRFTGAATLTNSASLILPKGVLNIVTDPGDYAMFVGYGGGITRLAFYQPKNGRALSGSFSAADFTAAILAGAAFGPFTSIASAATTDLSSIGTIAGNVTGTTGITSFGNVSTNLFRVLKFAGAVAITHNATTLKLLGGINWTTAAGDIGAYLQDSSGNWTEVFYQKADGTPKSFIISGLTEDTAPDAAADFLLTYDNSATLPKKVKPRRFFGLGNFKADRNGTNLTGLTASAFNKITLGNEVVDADSWFDNATNYRYTPLSPGWYHFSCSAHCLAFSANESPILAIYKNGVSALKGNYMTLASALLNSYVAQANGPLYANGTTDYFELWVYLPAGGTQVSGDVGLTFFSGRKVSD